jgi:hypothetical protein
VITMKMNRKSRSVLASVILALTLVTCGPAGMEMMGDAMVDAGSVMREAGQDAADAIRDSSADAVETATDTGATVLDDTGTAITDAAGGDAAAQDSCTTCTSTGAGHSVMASEDPLQALGGIVTGGPGRAIEVAVGPLYITDAVVFESRAPGGGDDRGVIVTVASADSCDDVHAFTASMPASAEVLVEPFRAANSGFSYFGSGGVHGARFFVPSGRRVCADAHTSGGSPAELRWAGFRPYD